jgi:peptidoglycan/xylan/chitin deacetylase (PgdA/CDA1 family)
MARQGIEFGSHLLHHKPLIDMSPGEREQELSRSRTELQALTGQEVLSIAYPYGDFNDDIVAQTEAAGYQYAVTILAGVNEKDAHPLRLSRFTAKGCKLHHRLKFRRMLNRSGRDARVKWPA